MPEEKLSFGERFDNCPVLGRIYSLLKKFAQKIEELPTERSVICYVYRCVAVGWGTTDANEGPPVETLRHVFLPVVSNSLCNSLPWLRGRISETMVCAGSLEGGRDTCGGDSGG